MYLFIYYFRKRDRAHAHANWWGEVLRGLGGAEGERESQADPVLSMEPDAGLDPRSLRS